MTFKKKFENFIYYYKWHTIIVIIFILVTAIGVKSCVSSKIPDINILYLSDKPVDSAVYKNFETALMENGLLKDINKDGKEYFYLTPIIISYDKDNPSDYMTYQHIQAQMISGTQSLMLVHQYVLEDYIGVFEDISAYAKEGDKTISGAEKFITGISVEGNKFLEGLGINTENLYASIHMRNERQLKKGELENEYKQGYKLLKYILDNQ